MPSKLKSDTARENGSKSNGPLTPEGKAITSRNSIRHGLTAKAVVLPGESQEEFQDLLDSYIEQFQPATAVERELVQSMAVTRWRLNRMSGIETSLFNKEIILCRDEMDKRLTGMEEDDRVAWAYQSLANSGPTLPLLLRYEGHLTRTYDRTFKQLAHLQRTRRAAPQPPQPNEPKPVAIHLDPRSSTSKKPNEPTPTPPDSAVTSDLPDTTDASNQPIGGEQPDLVRP